ncbi:MAG: right-handed parallel beta-helix repeat-containing protein, partial [Planctomycetota bacterium]
VNAEKTVQVSSLADLEIIGPERVRENYQAQYSLVAYYDNGDTADVTDLALWRVEPQGIATVEGGLLQTERIETAEYITIYAAYTGGGATVRKQMAVQISLPLEIEIIGPQKVRDNYQTQYKALVYYDNGQTRTVTDLASWWVEPNSFASIEAGLLQAGDIHQPQDMTIYAAYTAAGATVQQQMTVQVLVPPYIWYVPTDYETIQAAIDAAIDGDIVLVADGTYSGPGNENIDFFGKAITVRSENGPENCIIHPYPISGTRRGFYFHRNEGPDSVLQGFTITNCWSGHGGGGINCEQSSPTIRNCIISENRTANKGGGIRCSQSSARIINCNISENRAHSSGGIHCTNESNLTISNCTITGHRSMYDGGPLCVGGGIYVGSGSNATVSNCILWRNNARQGKQINIFGSMLIKYSNIDGGRGGVYSDYGILNWGEGNIDVDPLLAPDGYHLQPDSPCINAGDPPGNYSAQTDIDGEPRVMAARVDIGADEFFYDSAMLTHLQIAGSEKVGEYSSTQYVALTHYEGGSTADVTTSVVWSLQPQSCGTIDENGLLQTQRIETAEYITIYAEYTEADVTFEAEKTVQVARLVDLEIIGPQQARHNCQPQYQVVAHYDNGRTREVTDDADWWVEPEAVATIEAGLLQVEDISEPQDITLHARYTAAGATVEVEMTVQVTLPQTVHVPAQYETIQAAIDVTQCGDTVLVADGTYTGLGNRDIDFLGKVITVRSENGPENCIID